MSYNPQVTIPLEEPISISKKVTVANGESSNFTMQCNNVSCTQRELDYLSNTGVLNDLFTNSKTFDRIANWHGYVQSSTSPNGKIFLHFSGLTWIKISKLSKYFNCIHHKFGGINQCINKLIDTLYGSIFTFKDFSENQLCRNCIWHICSKKQVLQKLFDDYYNEYTAIFDDKGNFIRCKELLYFANCLLKYHMVVKVILNNPKLYKKLFQLFLFYLQIFDLKRLNFNKSFPCILNVAEHEYVIYKLNIATLCQFEYNLLGVVCCIKQIMPYFQNNHLKCLINKNYFRYFINFVNKYLSLEHMKILTNSIKYTNNFKDLDSIDLTSNRPMDLLLCVNGFLSELIFRKFKDISHKLSSKLKAKIFKISESRDKTYISVQYTPHLFFDKNRKLKNKFKYYYMCFAVEIQEYLNVKSMFKYKKKQLRKHRRCCYCNKKRHLKLCRQCKLANYCNIICQKRHWRYHKQYCKLFN